MKTKFLFATMVLPALFAACTSEEFIDSTANPALEGRELLDPNFSINVVGDEADTRFSWNAEEYAWNKFTAEDKFSAGLVDGQNVITNYIFSSEDGVSYKTNSQMVEGNYAFFSYDGFENNAAVKGIPFDLTGQVVTNLAKPDSIINGSQLFIAPMYTLDAETANEPMDLTFVSYWSVAAVKLHNTSGKALKLTSIMLNADASEAFKVKGSVDLDKLADYTYKYSETSDKYVFADKDATYDAFRTADLASATGISENPVLAIDCQGYILENNAEVTAYMQVPAGIYQKDMTVSVLIEDTDEFGTVTLELVKDVEKNAKKAATDAANNVVRFSRGKTTAVFGIEADAPAAYEIDEIELNGATISSGAYAASYADIVKILTDETVRGNVDVNNAASLKLDDRVINAIYRSDIGINFLNPIEITTNSRTAADVRNVKFQSGATLTEGKINLVEDVELPEGQTLTISEGTEATVEDGTYEGTIVNNGTLTLGKSLDLTIENGEKSELVIAASMGISDANVTLETNPASLTVNKDVTLTIGSGKEYQVADGEVLTNNGTITATGSLKNAGKIVNNGTITAIAENKIDDEKKVALIENYGTITTLTSNNGLIKMKSNKAKIESVTSNVDGEIDNTINGFITNVTSGSEGVIFAEYTGNQTGELGACQAVNTVRLSNGTWSNPQISAAIKSLEMSGVTIPASASDKYPAIGGSDLTSVVMENCTINKVVSLMTSGLDSDNLKVSGCTFNAPVGVMCDFTSIANTFNEGLVLVSSDCTSSLISGDLSSVTGDKKLTIGSYIVNGKESNTIATTVLSGTCKASSVEFATGATKARLELTTTCSNDLDVNSLDSDYVQDRRNAE